MKVLLGKKISMTQRFTKDGAVIPVTVVEAGPCVVTQVKTIKGDGYLAVQVGFGSLRRTKKPQAGHLKGLPPVRFLKEFRISAARASEKEAATGEELKRGAVLDVSVFAPGEKVTVTGTSKGKGFAGVMKRHHFKGAPATHGHKHDLRAPGSIGATWPQHVTKGTRMAGRMGGERTTMRNLEVLEVIPEKNLLLIKGAVPGARNSLLAIRGN